MAKSLENPAKYYQGSGLISDAYRYVAHIGRKFVVISDKNVKNLIEKRINEGFKNAGNKCIFLEFKGETTLKEVWRLSDIVTKGRFDGIIGAGGGKTLDVAKLVGNVCGLPVVSVPTIASNDSACSCMASIYDENNSFIKIQKLKESPAVILVDTEIIAKAPVSFIVAGMGEAYATYYAARACRRSGVLNYTGGAQTYTAFSLAKTCNEVLLKYGEKAIHDIRERRVSEAVENIIEANIYLSGIGYENNGCAASHAIYRGMTVAVKPFNVLQGEGTAFSLLVQLIMEYNYSGHWNITEWNKTIEFYKKIGLPRRFEQLNIHKADDLLLKKISHASCSKESNIYNMPFLVTEEEVFKALQKLRFLNLD